MQGTADILKGLSLEHIRSFQQVADIGGFRAAAQKMNVSQGTLSAHIAALEEALNVQLMARTTRVIKLTPAGERFLIAIRKSLEDLNKAVLDVVQDESVIGTRVVLACTPSLASNVVPVALKSFRSKCPNVFVEILDDAAHAVEELVIAGTADVGIGAPPKRRESLSYLSVGQETFAVLVPADHVLAKAQRIGLEDLEGQPLISMLPDTSVRSVIEAAFARQHLRFQPHLCVRHHPAAISLVEAGFGLTLLPRSILARANSDYLRVVPLKEDIIRELGVMQRRGEILNANATLLVHELRRALQRYRPGLKGQPATVL